MPTGDGVLAPVICRLGPIPIQIVGLEVGRGGWHEDRRNKLMISRRDSTCTTFYDNDVPSVQNLKA